MELVKDFFEGADNAALGGRVPDTANQPGGQWSDPANAWKISVNNMVPNADAGAGLALIRVNQPLVYAQLDLRLAVGDEIGFVLRHDGGTPGTYYLVTCAEASHADPGVHLWKVINGVPTLLHYEPFALSAAFDQSLQVLMNSGDTIYVAISIIDFTVHDDSIMGGYFGIQRTSSLASKWETFAITGDPGMADSIAILTPAAASSHVRTVSITGTTEGAPTSIEASIGGQPYQVIDPAPAANAFAGTYEYTHPIVGTLTVRWGNNHAITATQLNVTVTSNAGVPAGVTTGRSRRDERE